MLTRVHVNGTKHKLDYSPLHLAVQAGVMIFLTTLRQLAVFETFKIVNETCRNDVRHVLGKILCFSLN
jgi:hypothetical protein